MDKCPTRNYPSHGTGNYPRRGMGNYLSQGKEYPFFNTGCKTDSCTGYVYEAKGKCHEKITLPKGYYYKGAQCRYVSFEGTIDWNLYFNKLSSFSDENGPCGYKSWYGHYPDKCTCQTNICHKSIMACYRMGYCFYQGIVELQVQFSPLLIKQDMVHRNDAERQKFYKMT